MIRLFYLFALLFTLSIQQTYAGGRVSSGAGNFSNASLWSKDGYLVDYCIESGPNFPSKKDLETYINMAIEDIKSQLLNALIIKKFQKKRIEFDKDQIQNSQRESAGLTDQLAQTKFQIHEDCQDKSINFKFIFGSTSKEIDPKETSVSETDAELFGETRFKTEHDQYDRPQGSIYISENILNLAKDHWQSTTGTTFYFASGPLHYNKKTRGNLFFYVILHELGHAFGFHHIDESWMAERFINDLAKGLIVENTPISFPVELGFLFEKSNMNSEFKSIFGNFNSLDVQLKKENLSKFLIERITFSHRSTNSSIANGDLHLLQTTLASPGSRLEIRFGKDTFQFYTRYDFYYGHLVIFSPNKHFSTKIPISLGYNGANGALTLFGYIKDRIVQLINWSPQDSKYQ